MKHEQYTIIPSERVGLQTGDTCYILNPEDLLRIVDELTEEATDNLFIFVFTTLLNVSFLAQ